MGDYNGIRKHNSLDYTTVNTISNHLEKLAHWINPRVGILVTTMVSGISMGTAAWWGFGRANLALAIAGITLGILTIGFGVTGAIVANF